MRVCCCVCRRTAASQVVVCSLGDSFVEFSALCSVVPFLVHLPWCFSCGVWWLSCFCSCSLGAWFALLLGLSKLTVPVEMPRLCCKNAPPSKTWHVQ